jgi:hypothetical protein
LLKKFVGGVSYQLSVISYQLSVISYQLSVISYQLSVISYQLSVISYQFTEKTPHTPHPTPGKTFSADPSIGDSTGIWKNSIPKTLPR